MISSFVAVDVVGAAANNSFDFKHVELYMFVEHPHRNFRRQSGAQGEV